MEGNGNDEKNSVSLADVMILKTRWNQPLRHIYFLIVYVCSNQGLVGPRKLLRKFSEGSTFDHSFTPVYEFGYEELQTLKLGENR